MEKTLHIAVFKLPINVFRDFLGCNVRYRGGGSLPEARSGSISRRSEEKAMPGEDPDRQEQSSRIGLVALSRGCLRSVLISKEKREGEKEKKEQASDVHCAGRSVLHLPPLAQLHARKGLPEKSFNGIVGV